MPTQNLGFWCYFTHNKATLALGT